MFYDENSMKDMIKVSSEKKDYTPYLVIGEFFGKENTDNASLISYLEQWSDIVKATLGAMDAGHILNRGNIMVIVHDNNKQKFEDLINKTFVTSIEQTSGIRSSLLPLQKDDITILSSLF
ncbi:hypothetical protein [Guptibacillus spartinae]|uniref:hypothetical protein n=1 Tax=Guptibacillus spartinae TaxID=3025679 RepID=UPI002361CD9D|nr:hypothetical protein [Pseudalkalibacillus spartinae]